VILKNEKLKIDAVLVDDFTQLQYETYQQYLMDNVKENTAVSRIERAIVDASISANILQGVTSTSELPPRCVKWLTVKIDAFIKSQVEVPQD
jgi:hypothetical protein